MAKTATQWLTLYSETHRHPVNKKLHMICVPAIFWTAIALAWSAPLPAFAVGLAGVNWATFLGVLVLSFYATLGWRYFLGMLIVTCLAWFLSAALDAVCGPANLAKIAGLVFVVAWIGQFYGHKVEGKNPAFFTDLLFLLIGPLWILDHLGGGLFRA